MTTPSSPKPLGPWYKYHSYWMIQANTALNALAKARQNKSVEKVISDFDEFCRIRYIFESNLIEGAGASQGETKKIINENFPQIPSSFELFRAKPNFLKDEIYTTDKFEKMMAAINKHKEKLEKIGPCVLLEGKSKNYVEVAQHYIADIRSEFYATSYMHAQMIATMSAALETKELTGERRQAVRRLVAKAKVAPGADVLFSEEHLKELHRQLSDQLLPEDAGVAAGEYRLDKRMVDFDVMFPAPELVPECMKKFVTDSGESLRKIGRSTDALFEAAAKISYDFVRIHPFPDFNGRMSRIIMNMVFSQAAIPVHVSLRGDKKGKKRYYKSLRYANNGNLKPLEALIAMRFVETMRELDENLRIIGIELLPADF